MTRIMRISDGTRIKQATISRSIFAWLNTDARKDGEKVSKDSKPTISP